MSVEAEDRRVADTSRPWPARLLEVLRKFRVAAVTAVVALAAAATGLVFDLWPGLRPDPEVQLSATIKPVGLETRVWQADYFRRTGRDASGASNVWGDVVYLQVETKGLKGYESRLRWFVYNAREKSRTEQQPDDNVRLVSGTTSDRYVIPAWVQPPSDKGKYFVRFELRARGVLLAIADSPSFPYCRLPGCGAP